MMKIEELKKQLENKKIVYLLNDLECQCTFELLNEKIYFNDFTRGIYCHVDTQEKLKNILANCTWTWYN